MAASISAPSAVAPITALPDELHLQVFGFLTGAERASSSGVCKKFQAIAQDQKYLEDFLKVSSYPSGRWTVPQLWELFQRKVCPEHNFKCGNAQYRELGVHAGAAISPAYIIAFSPDSNHLACSSGGGVEVWNLNQIPQRQQFDVLSPRSQNIKQFALVAYSPNGGVRASALGNAGLIIFYNLQSTQLGDIPIQGAVKKIEFSPDGRFIAASIVPADPLAFDMNADIQPLDEEEEIEEQPHSTYVRVWRVDTREMVATFIPEGYSDFKRSLVFSEDSSRIITVSRQNNTIDVYNIDTNAHTRHLDTVTTAALSPCNSNVVYGTRDGRVVMWNIQSNTIRTSAPPVDGITETMRVTISPCGNKIAVGWQSGYIAVLDFAVTTPQKMFVSIPHTPPALVEDEHSAALGLLRNPYLESQQ